MLAAEQGNLEIVQELLKKGANCNLEDAVSIGTLLKYLTAEEEEISSQGKERCLDGSSGDREEEIMEDDDI